MPLAIVFSSPGTYTIDDDGIPGNNTSVVRDSAGVVVTTFVHPADTLTFTTITPGVNLIFNTRDSFGSANLAVGSLTSAAQSPDSIVVRHLRTDAFATLVSNGSITEGGADTPADIIAAAVTLSAATGIGTPGNALETQTTFIEAETNTGGISIANFGLVQIGGITPDVRGLDVATSGDLNFSTVGSIFLSDTSGPSTLHGGDLSGNVTLTAIGADADIYAPINHPTAYAAGGGITFNAGRNFWAGPGGANFNNDILATTFVSIHAGQDFLLDGTSDIRTGAFGGVVGGPIDIQAGRNITLDNTTGGLQTIQAFAGNVTLTTGPGGAFIEKAAFPGAISTTDDIILNADTVQIVSGGVNTTGIGSVTIRPVTPGRAIDIGSAVDLAGALTLSDAELDLLFTLNVNIGDANSGPVAFSAPVTPFIVDNMVVSSATEILVNSSITLARTLTLRAGDDLFFTPTGSFTTSNGDFTGFVDQVGDDGNTGGFGILNGTITATAVSLNGNADADTLNGGGANEMIDGAAGNDTLRGFGGNDTLIGGLGVDTMIGGLGNDTYVVDNVGDVVTEAVGEGVDAIQTVLAGYNLTAIANVENLTGLSAAGQILVGNSLGNVITGNAGSDTLDGLGGDDTLNGLDGIDTLFGGPGNDTFIIGNSSTGAIENPGEGTDTVNASVTYVLGSNVENLNLTGTNPINGTGNNLANTIAGNNAANIIDGGTGIDSLFGGGGNDIYIVRNSATGAFENAAEGTDTVKALGVSYILGSHVENLDLIGAGALNGTGNNLDNLITGNILANVLDGGIGVDMLYGGLGDDTYIIHNSASGAIENPGEGTDVVIADVSYVLGSNVENLALIGAGAINGTGNNLDNTITGNSVGNILDGGSGEDILFGAGGGDTLFANSAGDQLYGSTGDDVYYLTTGALGAFENAAEGTDWVFISGNYSLGSNIENLVLTGTGDFFGAGNGLDNLIYSNNHSDTLSGGIGGDTLVGGTGIDSMYGGVGNDLYYVHNSSAGAFENAGEGTDWVFADASFTLGSNVENIVLTGAGAIDATGNGANNRIEGNTGNNNLIGNGGADRFVFAAAGTHHDTIYDFDSINVAAGHDLIDFQGRGLNFGALTINQVGADTQILIGGDEITLKNVLKTSVDAGDFVF